ncbi:hypothetical protein RXP90_30230 [Pseudomonas aeruginosa]|nr:hypothetical protein [Pseudomonas aeruginosa]
MPLIVVEVATPHGTEWFLTETPEDVAGHHPDWHEQGITLHAPEDIIARQFNGWAVLSTCQ